MSQHNYTNFVYFSSREEKRQEQEKGAESLDKKTLDKILQSLATQSMRERSPSVDDLESILASDMRSDSESEAQTDNENLPKSDDPKSITRLLIEQGYLREEKNWLTKKGFFAIGNKILRDLMGELKTGDFGLHEIKSVGEGTTILDTTKKVRARRRP